MSEPLPMSSPISSGPSCQQAGDLLPWLLNGSLEEHEERSVKNHLSSCERCRFEFEEAVEAWSLLTTHLSSFVLAEYALGVEVGDRDRERIERHLAVCSLCHEEVERIGSDQLLDFVPRRELASPPVRRHWAIAAGFAAAFVSGGLLWTQLQPSSTTFSEVAAVAAPSAELRVMGALFTDGFDSGTTAAWSGHQIEPSQTPR